MLNVKKIYLAIATASVVLLNGCSSGDLRAFNDGMS
jgi:hypothetical protein